MYYKNDKERNFTNSKQTAEGLPFICIAVVVTCVFLAGFLNSKHSKEGDCGSYCESFNDLKVSGDEQSFDGCLKKKVSADYQKALGFDELKKRATCSLGNGLLAKVSVDGKEKFAYVGSGLKVSDFLENEGIVVGAEDIVNVGLNENVRDCMNIVINRACCTRSSKIEFVPFSRKKIPTDALFKGQTKLKTAGQNGEIERVFENEVVDGKVIKTKEVGCNVLKQPVDEEVLVGTRKRVRRGLGNFGFNYSADGDVGAVTAYCDRGRTATGTHAGPGTIAANFKKYKPGTKLQLVDPKNGKVVYEGVVADTGGALRKGRANLDIWIPTEADCRKFGRRNLKAIKV